MAEKIAKVKWFLEKAEGWKDKRLAVFCVGGTPNGEPQADLMLKNALTEEQKMEKKNIDWASLGFGYIKTD